MEITEVRVSLVNDAKLKARVTITFDNCFVIRGLKVIRGNRGMFVAMPARRKPDGKYQDFCHPINLETREWMEQIILARYDVEQSRRDARRQGADARVPVGARDEWSEERTSGRSPDSRREETPPGLHIGL
jgi:stage V sporulation protein G